MALPTTVEALNDMALDMSEVADLGRRRTVHGHRGELGEKIGIFDPMDLKSTKPWLFAPDIKDGQLGMESSLVAGTSRSTGSVRGPNRARSFPGPLNDQELKAWMAELESNRGTPAPPPPVFVNDEEIQPTEQANSYMDESEYPTLLLAPGPSRRRPMSPTEDYGSGSNGTSNPRPNLHSLRSDSCRSRGYSSLDLGRPTSRPGGREMADDADEYAMMHGARRARRPDFGRLRGDSRAALLGRLEVDDTSTTRDSIGGDSEVGSGSGSWSGRRQINRDLRGEGGDGEVRKLDDMSRGTGTAPAMTKEEYAHRTEHRDTLGAGLEGSWTEAGRGNMRENGSGIRSTGGMNKGKEREYGRSRGESGAALLGRPDLEYARGREGE